VIDPLNLTSELIELAILVFGTERGLNHTQEECAELIVAINHYRRGRISKEAVAEEIADVYIMCHRMAKIIGEHLVDQKVLEKCQVTRDYIKKELESQRDAQTANRGSVYGARSEDC
jgi:NTP pyrophosphatase (non-canonical NTP hydrolase)